MEGAPYGRPDVVQHLEDVALYSAVCRIICAATQQEQKIEQHVSSHPVGQ